MDDERAREGRRLAGRYRLGQPLARGALCPVYRGEDEILSRQVAIKVVAPAHIAAYRAALAGTPTLAHPATVITYDTVAEDGWLYLVQELIAGKSLAGLLRTGLSARQAINAGTQLAHLLAYAHQRDILHGDVTPAAVLIERDETVRLNNFGLPPDPIQFAHYAEAEAALAAYLGADVPGSPRANGAAASTAPMAASATADVRAVGLLLWQALAPVGPTGERTGFRPDVPPELRGLVVRLLLPGHSEAITNAEDLAATLDALDEELASLRVGERQPTPALVRSARERAARAADSAPWSRADTLTGDPPPWSATPAPGNSATTIPGMYPRAALDVASRAHPTGDPWRARATKPLGNAPSGPLRGTRSGPLPGPVSGPLRGPVSGPLPGGPAGSPHGVPSSPARLSAGPRIGPPTGRLSTPIAWSDDPEVRRAVDEWVASARSPGTGALGDWLLWFSGGQRFRVLPVVLLGLALFALCFVLGYLVPLVIAPR